MIAKRPLIATDLLGDLFEAMNHPGKRSGGRFKDVDYFNGGLFAVPARLELYDDELTQLRQAAKENWSKVRPEIFGTLFEHSLEKEERHAYGGHFTTAGDIMKIVRPTITEPWRETIEQAGPGTPAGREARTAPQPNAAISRPRSGLRLRQLPLSRLPRTQAPRK